MKTDDEIQANFVFNVLGKDDELKASCKQMDSVENLNNNAMAIRQAGYAAMRRAYLLGVRHGEESAPVLTMPDAIIEHVVKSIMENFPEASHGMTLRCTDWRYDDWKFTFQDHETSKEYTLNKKKLLASFALIFGEGWPGGCTPPPWSASEEMWDDWLCKADACDFDAFAQLACLGEVIYG